MLPLFVKAFVICVKDKYDVTDINLLTLITDENDAIAAYRYFNGYLTAVEAVVRYGREPERAIMSLLAKCSYDSFKDSLQYLKKHTTESEICLYLD